MKENESLPGYIKYEFDLSKLDIPEDLYPLCSVLRIADNKKFHYLSSRLNDSILTFESDNNSKITVGVTTAISAIGAGIAAGVSGGIAVGAAGAATAGVATYKIAKYYLSGTEHVPFNDKTQSNYVINFPRQLWEKDEPSDELKKLLERNQAVWKKYDFDFNKGIQSNIDKYKTISDGPKLLLSLLKRKVLKDPEFIEIQKTIRNPKWRDENFWPKSVKKLIDSLVKADSFLFKTGSFRKPCFTTDIYLDDDESGKDKCAEEDTSNIELYPHINVYSNNHTFSDPNQVLLTLVHEMTHVLQDAVYLKGLSGANYVPFKEATAVMVEKAAFDYYKKENVITSQTDITTNNNDYQHLVFSFLKPQYWGEGHEIIMEDYLKYLKLYELDDAKINMTNKRSEYIDHGYTASSFLIYFKNKHSNYEFPGSCAFVRSCFKKSENKDSIDIFELIRDVINDEVEYINKKGDYLIYSESAKPLEKLTPDNIRDDFKEFCLSITENNKSDYNFLNNSAINYEIIKLKNESIHKIEVPFLPIYYSNRNLPSQPMSMSLFSSGIQEKTDNKNTYKKMVYVKDNNDEVENVELYCMLCPSGKRIKMDKTGIIEIDDYKNPSYIQIINNNLKPGKQKSFRFEEIAFVQFKEPQAVLNQKDGVLEITSSETLPKRDNRFTYEFIIYSARDKIVCCKESKDPSIRIPFNEVDSDQPGQITKTINAKNNPITEDEEKELHLNPFVDCPSFLYYITVREVFTPDIANGGDKIYGPESSRATIAMDSNFINIKVEKIGIDAPTEDTIIKIDD